MVNKSFSGREHISELEIIDVEEVKEVRASSKIQI